ncbi:MAG: UPF0175 family protein [Candidatus Binatus sp.]|uniref:UPF0175 family protein n=1 Tax=Candidatus Binatus sp. TaxID=2811406 RepID=UPI00271C73FF|nr:UPF0175 family protein [Candidatus Binatus sp.]MDO8432265.1 UPF0175 family protein [Candidatus Binatus sp.]
MATTIKLELPEEIASRLRAKWKDLPRAALESLLADGYRSELLSADQVRQLLGFGSRMRVDEFLKQHGVYDYTAEDFEQDRLTLHRLKRRAGKRQ